MGFAFGLGSQPCAQNIPCAHQCQMTEEVGLQVREQLPQSG